MIVIVAIMLTLYGLACTWLTAKWLTIPAHGTSDLDIQRSTVSLSVVIAVRNEATNIAQLLEDLSRQTLPKEQFEVIIADDASTDETAWIVECFAASNNFVKLIKLSENQSLAPKKRAIAEAINIARGTHIVTTDGDCRVGEKWLECIVQTFVQTQAKFISGPVTFFEKPWGIFNVFQLIEFSSLIGVGACTLQAGQPTMCNGANLAYERRAFEAVGGFAGTDHIASGDDELLMQKIAKQFAQSLVFLKTPMAIVQTAAMPSLSAFYEQRLRWGSKWAVNARVSTITTAVFVFLVNALFIGTILGGLLNDVDDNQFIAIFFVKIIPEFCFLAVLLHFLNKKRLIFFIPFVQLVYPWYVLFFGIVAQRKGYTWKGRKLR